MLNKVLIAAFLFLLVPIGRAEPARAIRMAIVSEEEAVGPAADFLTAELSKDNRLALLERDQITKVLNEQALAMASSGGRDYLKVGELLGADGLLVLTLAEKDDRKVVSCRLVAVKPGVDLGLADYDYPLADPEEWSKLLAAQFQPLIYKLTVLRRDAVPISILNLRSATASTEGEVLEHQLTLLLQDRLMTEKNLFVLERRGMEKLTDEKAEKSGTESPFWNGSYLVEGSIDPQGFNSNQVTVDIQITPPDKKNVITVEATGPRANLTEVINDLASRITGSVNKGKASTPWSADDEAKRYSEEAKWMLRWGMFEEARTASESAWALGQQTQEVAELRVQAYQGYAGGPGRCMVMENHVFFFEPAQAGILGLNGIWNFHSEPSPARFSAAILAGELWLDGIRRLSLSTNTFHSSFYNLGTNSLNQCSWWLRYFYFTVEARRGVEDDLPRTRNLCREMSQALLQQADGERKETLLHLIAKHKAFWTESPEQTLRGYREFVDNGQWPAIRTRFLNDTYMELTQENRKKGYSNTTGHEASENADPCSPCLAGWDWEARQRCPDLWLGFISELCNSSKPLIQMEGLILQCSWAWSDADFKKDLSRLEDFMRQQSNSIADNRLDEKLMGDLGGLVNRRAKGMVVNLEDPALEESWKGFKHEFSMLLASRREQTAEEADLKLKGKYLETQTNFDFMSFAQTLLNGGYTAHEARALLPLVTNYQVRIKGLNQDQMNRTQADYWIAHLENKLIQAIAPPLLPTKRLSIQRPFQPQPPNMAQMSPGAQFFPGAVNPMGEDKSVAQKCLSSVSSTRYWQLPAEDGDGQPIPPGFINSLHYRDGKLWAEELYMGPERSDRADFYSVNLKTFLAGHVKYKGDKYSFMQAMMVAGKNAFEVDSTHLYLRVQDAVHRYSFAKKNWDILPSAGEGIPQRLADRLFLTSKNSIQEYLPDGSFRLLASSRRRPALNVLDDLEDYDPCHLFLDAQGRLNICAHYELYVSSGTNDWQHYGTLASKNAFGAEMFDDGVLVRLMEDWWGIFQPCQKPELLFHQQRQMPGMARFPPFHDPRLQSTEKPRWQTPPPAPEACLDGDCIWFLADASVPRPRTFPSLSAPPAGGQDGLSLVRYKYGDPDPMPIALTLSKERPASHGRAFNGPSWMNEWILTKTPEGLIASRKSIPGFWLIAQGDLRRSIEASSQPSSNP